MKEIPPLGVKGSVACALVVVLAAGLRIGYLASYCDFGNAPSPLQVQGEGLPLDVSVGTSLRGREAPNEFDDLVHNLREHRWFGGLAPLANVEERTGHVAPGYYWLASLAPGDSEIRQFQTALSILTVLLLFLQARQAFASNLAASFVGFLAALHPFWIVNLGELADGTLATFLLVSSLFLGSHAIRSGGPLTSVLFGLNLAGLALVRASLLPFAFLALGWFLLRCRTIKLGWFAGLLALLGFGNGLAPWIVRSQNAFQQPVPVVTSAYLHLWIGNMAGATGGPADEKTLRNSLSAERLQSLLDEPNQTRRYNRLSHELVRQIREDPGGVLMRRLSATMAFLVGESAGRRPELVRSRTDLDTPVLPAAVKRWAGVAVAAGLLVPLTLGLFGWRCSFACGESSRLANVALIWLPLPFVLSHAERMSGPRLPWDAILILFAGYALAWLFPSVRRAGGGSCPPSTSQH